MNVFKKRQFVETMFEDVVVYENRKRIKLTYFKRRFRKKEKYLLLHFLKWILPKEKCRWCDTNCFGECFENLRHTKNLKECIRIQYVVKENKWIAKKLFSLFGPLIFRLDENSLRLIFYYMYGK